MFTTRIAMRDEHQKKTEIQSSPKQLPSGKHTKNYGKSPFSMGKLTISMAIFHRDVWHNQRVAMDLPNNAPEKFFGEKIHWESSHREGVSCSSSEATWIYVYCKHYY